MYSLLKATLIDAEEILALQKLCFRSEAEYYNNWNLPPVVQSLDSLQNEFANSVILKAVMDNQIIGSVRSIADNDCCKIGRLIVHPDHQKQGIGSNLLSKIESLNSNAKFFELFTGVKSFRNIRLYEKHGYKTTYTKTFPDNVEVIFMEKTNTNPLAGWDDLDPGTIYRHLFSKV